MYDKYKIYALIDDIYKEAGTTKPYVLIAQPRRSEDEIPAQDFNKNIHLNLDGHSKSFINIFGQKVDVARNYLIESAISIGAKYLFFIGEDTVVPYDAFSKLHETSLQHPDAVVCGVYYYKLGGPMIVVREDDYLKVPNCDRGQVIDAWLTGMDCMLIPVSILKDMKEKEPDVPFCCVYNEPEKDLFVGEDNFFTYRLRQHKYKLLVNTDVQCLHIDLVTGRYTAHPSVQLNDYKTNIPITGLLDENDRDYLEKRWIDRLPKGEINLETK